MAKARKLTKVQSLFRKRVFRHIETFCGPEVLEYVKQHWPKGRITEAKLNNVVKKANTHIRDEFRKHAGNAGKTRLIGVL